MRKCMANAATICDVLRRSRPRVDCCAKLAFRETPRGRVLYGPVLPYGGLKLNPDCSVPKETSVSRPSHSENGHA
jgi:hypothetical protein